MPEQRIAFIGLGTMGKPMATNLCQKGFPITVVDVRPEPVAELTALGARSAATPREAAEQADVAITMVWDGKQTKEVMLGPNGAVAGLKPGGHILLMNTIDPQAIRDVAAAAAERGIHVLDCPVSGARERAGTGTLTIMVGGDQDAYERMKPVLDAMGTEVFYLGGLTAGITGKLVNNMLVGVHIIATGELLRLGKQAGVDSDLLVDMIKTATGSSTIVRAWKKIDRAFDVGDYFRKGGVWDLVQKDIHLALAYAQQQGVDVPLADLAGKLYDGLDFSPGVNPFV